MSQPYMHGSCAAWTSMERKCCCQQLSWWVRLERVRRSSRLLLHCSLERAVLEQ